MLSNVGFDTSNIFTVEENADFLPIADEIVEKICKMAVPKDKCILPGGQLVMSGKIYSAVSLSSLC